MATGNKLVREITDQFLHCKICYEPYKEPKTLSCLHTFCTDCIQKHVDSDNGRSSRFLLYNRYITCPLCRSKTEIPTGGIRRLPDNFLVSSLTDVLDRKRVGKFPPCEICPGESRSRGNNAASHKCLDCTKMLCKSCVELHATTRVTQNHSLIDIEGEKDIECKKHPEEIVRYYCEPCEECVCVVCTFQEHRDHEICSFSDGFTKYKSGLDELLNSCKERLSDVQKRLSAINKVETTLKDTRESIRDLAISYIAQVRSTERQLMQRLEEEFGSKVQNFLQNKEWLQENMDGLSTTCNLAEIIMNDKGIEMLLLKKELQSKLSTLLEPALPVVPDDLTHNIKFIPGNVKLGDITTNSNNEMDDADDDGGSVKRHIKDDDCRTIKRQCTTRDTQTDNEPVIPAISSEINFDMPTTNFSRGTYSVTNNNIKNGIDNLVSIAKTDVSVNTMCSMSDSKHSLPDEVEPCSPSVCVKCCAELKKDFCSSTGSLPIIDGTPPAILDINITNYDDGDKREPRRRRRSLIKSRRVQTDISLSNESLDDPVSPLRVSSQDSLNRSYNKAPLALFSVAERVNTCTVGLDPIDFGFKFVKEKTPPKKYTKSKGVNTTQNVKIVPETRSMRTNTDPSSKRESSTMTAPSIRTTDTQTPEKNLVNKLIATDYAGQRNKRTSTPIIVTVDNSTCMPSVTQESKVTWTDAVQTTDRSVCTHLFQTSDSATDPVLPSVCDQGVLTKPEMKTSETNTDPIKLEPISGASGVKEKEKKPKTKDREKEKDKKDKTLEKKKRDKDKKERKEKKKFVDSCTETVPVIRNDKETGTNRVQLKDSWTETVSPQLINTGISPARPATREAVVNTDVVITMDQSTHTNVVKYQESGTETIINVCDGETLTERIGTHDQETCVDIFTENVETSTDTCHKTDTGCSTDADWQDEKELNVVICDVCQETRAFVDVATSPIPCNDNVIGVKEKSNKRLVDGEAQTTPIELYDKIIATSCDLNEVSDCLKECIDEATSTENLPYIGLLSDMDCDELILVPEIAFDLIGSDSEYEQLYNDSFPVSIAEASAQTDVSSATLNIDHFFAIETEYGPDVTMPNQDNLVTIGVNTEHKQTFEKETCTALHHYLSRATSTSLSEKIDKSTSTDSYVRTMQETFGQSPGTERSTKLAKLPKKDVSVETDATLMDEKMIACINKLKTVSERLNSPTSKSPPECPPWSKSSSANSSTDTLLKDLDKASDVERKKNVLDLVAKSQAMAKSKDSKTEPVRRKAQPITTLKARYTEKPNDADTNKTEQTKVNTVKNGAPSTPAQKRAASSRRNNSAPGRIATVPNQAALRSKTSPKVTPKSPHLKQQAAPKMDQSATLPSQKHDQTHAEFYSTVPKTRHPKHGLPSILETRPSSTGSDMTNNSTKAFTENQPKLSNSSLDSSLDFSSLKITAPPRQPSVSPTPVRHAIKKDTRSPRQEKKKPTIEVVPAIDPIPDSRSRTGSTSSEQTDNEPSQEKKGFMKKLFGSKKKKGDKRTSSPSKSPKPGRKALEAPPNPPPEEPKEKPKEKPKPFVYMRSRIFSIEQKDEDKYNKPIVNKYCVTKDEEKPPMFDFAATFTKKK